MSFLRQFASRLLALLRPRAASRLDEELGAHFDLLVEENRARGMPQNEAQDAARRTLGHPERIREAWRDQRGLPWLESFFQDVRYGLRLLRKNPGFAAIAIATLALGIGANTAIFSVVDAVLLHPLPYRDPGRLVVVWQKNKNGGWNQFPTPSYIAWQKQPDLFAAIAASSADSFVLASGDRPDRIPGARVTASYFPLLGVQPFFGRSFLPREDVPGGPRVVILSYGLWQRLGADRSIIGRPLVLDGAASEVVGVLPAGFLPTSGAPQLWLPLQLDSTGATNRAPGLHWLLAIARLRPGASLAQTQSRIDAVAPSLARQYPGTEIQYGAALQSLTDLFVGDTRPTLVLLFVVVGLVLVIACVNVVNLLLARSGARSLEMAVRAALGANPGRIVCQTIAEGLVLAALGGAAALLLTWAAMPLLVWLGSLAGLPRSADIRVDSRLLVFAALIALAAGLLFSLWPAREALRHRLIDSLKLGSAASGSSPRRRRGRGLLIVCEIALATMLLAAAGLLLRSFVTLLRVPPGFDTAHLATLKISVPGAASASPAKLQAFRDRLAAAAASVPGVRSAALARDLPFSGTDPSLPFIAADRAMPAPADAPPVRYRLIGPGYFRAMGIPLLAGRDFNSGDNSGSSCVVIVSRSLARQTWEREDPIGRVIRNGYPGRPACAVIGVVADVKHWLGVPDEATAYYAYAQLPAALQGLAESYITVVAQASSAPAPLLSTLRDAIQSVAPESPVYDLATMSGVVSRAETRRSFALLLVGAFAALALLMGIVGVYGVLVCSVAERTRELSIRLALGAVPGEVARFVVAEGLRLTLAGVAVGLLAALALARFLSSQLFGVRPDDPLTFGAVGLLLILLVAVTCYLPARRATRVDPAAVLRGE